jgi:uncharacterized protein (UPF0548 family)
MLDVPWVRLYPDRPSIRRGLTVLVAARTVGVWSLNPARIVDVVEGSATTAFSYGTLRTHAATGEERFSVGLSEEGRVEYTIVACSRLRHPLARAAPPIARHIQDRFAAESLQAMVRAVGI